KIYGQPDKPYFVKVGHIAGAESIPALIDINKLVTRHSAIVGTTGSGKSTTVASILNAISDPVKYPSARVIVFDLHGEYGHALKDRANIFKVNADKTAGSIEKDLFIPFWALSFEELCNVSFGKFNNEKDENIILERITLAKRNSLQLYAKDGVSEDTLNVDSPIAFSLNKLWHELYHECFATYYSKNKGLAFQNLAYEKDGNGKDLK